MSVFEWARKLNKPERQAKINRLPLYIFPGAQVTFGLIGVWGRKYKEKKDNTIQQLTINTSDFGSEESRFEPWSDNSIHPNPSLKQGGAFFATFLLPDNFILYHAFGEGHHFILQEV